jgi:hypothetical protein
LSSVGANAQRLDILNGHRIEGNNQKLTFAVDRDLNTGSRVA